MLHKSLTFSENTFSCIIFALKEKQVPFKVNSMKNKTAFQKMIFRSVFSILPLLFIVFNSDFLPKRLIINERIFFSHCYFTVNSLYFHCYCTVKSLLFSRFFEFESSA
jgi:hypothetical protein